MALLKNAGAPLANRYAPGFLNRYHQRFLAHLLLIKLQPGAPLVNQLAPGLFSSFFQNIYKKELNIFSKI